MNELTVAAFIGAFASALQKIDLGWVKMTRVMITGFSLAFFVGADVANFIQQFFNFHISHGGTIFLVAFFGTEVSERLILIARSMHVNNKWSE